MHSVICVGHNHEMADFDNPRGEIYADQQVVVATAESGQRFALNTPFTKDEEGAELMKFRIESHIANGGILNMEKWTEIDPCYGSPYYQSSGQEQIYAEMERREEMGMHR